LLPALGLTLSLGLPTAQRLVPLPRMWLFLLPVVLACASCGLVEMLRAARGRMPVATVAGLVVAMVLLAAIQSAASTCERAHLISEDSKTLVDAEDIVKDMRACDAEGRFMVIAAVPGIRSIEYYRRVNHLVPAGSFLAEAVFVVVGDQQTVTDVLSRNPQRRNLAGRLVLWKQYPHATVYVLTPT
jgi:hypothetical protein